MCKHFLTATQAGVRFTVRHEASGESQEGRGREEDGRRWTGRERDRVEGREGEGRRKEGEGRERKRCKEMDREERDRERGGREGERGRERRRGLRDGRETKSYSKEAEGRMGWGQGLEGPDWNSVFLGKVILVEWDFRFPIQVSGG